MIKDYASKLYGYEIGHAPANLATQRILSEKHSTCVFRKYRRAQITLFRIHTASVALALTFYSSSFRRLATCTGGLRLPLLQPTLYHSFQLLILQSFTSPVFHKYQTTPYSDLYCRKSPYYFDFYRSFFNPTHSRWFCAKRYKRACKTKEQRICIIGLKPG